MRSYHGRNNIIFKPGRKNNFDLYFIFLVLFTDLSHIRMGTFFSFEEVAYDVVHLANKHQGIGSGVIGELSRPMDEIDFLAWLKKIFNLTVIRHTALLNK